MCRQISRVLLSTWTKFIFYRLRLQLSNLLTGGQCRSVFPNWDLCLSDLSCQPLQDTLPGSVIAIVNVVTASPVRDFVCARSVVL